MAPDSKPASPSPVAAQNQKTEFLIQADDQTSYELWKSKLEKVTRPSDECTVSVVVFFFCLHNESLCYSSSPNHLCVTRFICVIY